VHFLEIRGTGYVIPDYTIHRSSNDLEDFGNYVTCLRELEFISRRSLGFFEIKHPPVKHSYHPESVLRRARRECIPGSAWKG
jgi:hypothetical protein